MSKPRRRKSRPPTPSSSPPPVTSRSSVPPVATRSSAPPSSSPSKRKRKRRRTSATPRTPVPYVRSAPTPPLVKALGALAVLLVLCVAPLWVWSVLPGPGAGKAFVLEVAEAEGLDELSERLVARGALRSPRLFRTYLQVLQPGLDVTHGDHVLNDGASPRELAQRLGRGTGRSSQRVTFPEGFQSLQIGQRLEHAEVCPQVAFRLQASNPSLLRELEIEGPSAEGYLFPASYGLLVDSEPAEVVRVLVTETKKRLSKLFEAHPGRLDQLRKEFGFREREVLVLASMVEKEAQVEEERPLIASVFFNRLRDAEFRPARMLQSDPTASYGCLVAGADVPSCAGFRGSVTPAMLRDPANPYNTYRHAGLPPGPIANPGEASIRAVLAPAQSDYLYFVAKGAGRHSFSRTFAEHREAVETPH